MRLILVRHALTVENEQGIIQGIIQGHLPGMISEQWVRDAEKLALRLKNEKISTIYSSDFARAKDPCNLR